MRITITVPDELAEQAGERGLSIEAYVQRLIDQALPESPSPQRPRRIEDIDAFLVAMAEGSEELPLLPTESFTRESFYEDRH